MVVYYVIGKKEAFEIMQSFVEDGALALHGVYEEVDHYLGNNEPS